MLYAKTALMKVTTQCSGDIIQGLVFVCHKLYVHHFVIAECRRFQQHGVAVYVLMKTLLLCTVLAPNSHRCHLYSEQHSIFLFRFSVCVNGREAFGVGGWVSRLKPTSPMLRHSKLIEVNRVFLLLKICSFQLQSPHLFHILLNFMEQIEFSETNSFTTTHDSPCILWNPKVHYLFLKSRQLVHVLRQMNPFHTLPTFLIIFISILSSNLCLRPYKWSHSFRSPYKNPLFLSLPSLPYAPKISTFSI
jgi:hypothetical protein